MISVQQGAVVFGKNTASELIPELLRELERLEPNALEVGAPRADEIRQAISQGDEPEAVLEDLICALSDCAGDRDLYFGRKSSGSNVFGFWKSDD
jgi:hypothetical protein